MGLHRIPFLLALGATTAWAAGPAAAPPPTPADASATVTVTAEATPVELVKTPNPVVVIDKATLEARGDDNLGDLLQAYLPGQVFASGGVGTASSLGLGGGRTTDTVVTLDGIRLTDAAGLGGINLSIISLAGIERIEIQQGPCSTRFGSDAQAGVVAMYSAGHAPEGISGQVRAGLGTDNIHEAAFAPAYGWGSGWVRAAVSAQKEDGATPADNPYRATGSSLSMGQQLGEDTLVTVNYLNSYAGVPLPIVYVTPGPRDPSQYDPTREDFNRMQVLSGTLRTALNPDLTAELTLGQVLQIRQEPDPGNTPGTTPVYDRYLSRRNQANGALTWKASEANTLQGGFDAYEETAFSFGYDPASGRHLALFLEDQWEVTRDLRLVGSVRGEQDRLTFPTGLGGTQNDDVSQATWKLGLNWLLGEGFRFYASTGTAFANPLLFQTIYNAQNGPQPLDNERSTTTLAGLTWGAGPWSAKLELSRTNYANLIYYNPGGGQFINQYGGYWTGIYQNGSDLMLQSAQLTGGYKTKVWSLEGFYRNQEFKDENAAPGQDFLNTAVIRRPFQSLGLNGHRTFGPVRLEARWSWIGPRYDYGVPNPSNPSASAGAFDQHYNDLSVLVAWTPVKDLVLSLRGDHLMQPRTSVAQWLAGSRDFQNDATQIYGYPAQPPTATLEVRYRF